VLSHDEARKPETTKCYTQGLRKREGGGGAGKFASELTLKLLKDIFLYCPRVFNI
jgi:hypothetical protein